jgi:MFS family permease
MRLVKGRYAINVISLGLVSLFTDASTEMIMGLLPLFIVIELHAGSTLLGLIEGLAEGLSYGFRLVSGTISDKVGKRKPMVLAGYTISTILKPLFALATSWFDALLIRLGDRVGKGVRTSPRDALISASVEKEYYGRAFGLQRTLDQLGAIAGPLVAFLLLPLFGFRGVFLLSLIPGALAVMILALFVKEVKVEGTVKEERSIISQIGKVLEGKFLRLIFVTTLFSISAFNFSFILLTSMYMGIGKEFAPLIYALINIPHTLVGYPAGGLYDKIGGFKALSIGYLLFFLTALLGILGKSIYVAIIMALLFGVYLGFVETIQRSLVANYSKPELKGSAFGLYYLFTGSAFLFANLIFGYIWENFSPILAFTYSTIISGVSLMLILALLRGD